MENELNLQDYRNFDTALMSAISDIDCMIQEAEIGLTNPANEMLDEWQTRRANYYASKQKLKEVVKQFLN